MTIRFRLEGDTEVFPAHGRGGDWNGWLCPIVDRRVTQAVVDRLSAIDDELRVSLTFTGDGTAKIDEYVCDGKRRELVSEQLIVPMRTGTTCWIWA